MVESGQYLERMTVIPSGSATLEGLYHRGSRRPPVVVAPPHPRLGGSMDAPLCAELSFALSHAGHATLRFNYRGVGASTGAVRGSLDDLDDVAAALLQLCETAGSRRAAVAGYSFGAWLALHLAARDARVSHVIAVAPPTRVLSCDFAVAQAHGAALHVIVGEHDAHCDVAAVCNEVVELGGSAQVIRRADHSFQAGLVEVGRLTVAALLG